ncbi:CpsD/CapB family tyrosine-protein kinase [bacterium]|nr:CpsD/CapB family tyrosine-protein kinase [bacterium]
MARMLDALERARKEREQKLETDTAPAQPEAAAADPAPAAATPPGNGNGNTPSRAAAFHPEIDERVVGVHDLQSPVTEQIRLIRTNLESVLADYHSRSIVVTSPGVGDGKTMVSANLAGVLADDPATKVLLIDADLRGPVQHKLFGLRQTPGLADYLQGRATIEQTIQMTSLPNLHVITAGHLPPKPPVLLGSEWMQALLGELQKTYHWIVIDTPPLLAVTDATVVARECVGLILVVRMGKTPRTLIERAQGMLAEMRLPVLGCILNDFASQQRSDHYYYRYYKDKDPREADGFRA